MMISNRQGVEASHLMMISNRQGVEAGKQLQFPKAGEGLQCFSN
jgi:hypothetical protein